MSQKNDKIKKKNISVKDEQTKYTFVNVSEKVKEVGDKLVMPITKVVYNDPKQILTVVSTNDEAVGLNIQQHENSKFTSVTSGRRFLNAVCRATGMVQNSTINSIVDSVNSQKMTLTIEMKEMSNGYSGRLYTVS